MSKLTYGQRKALPKSQFAIPSEAPEPGSYPIDTKNRARNALARVSQFGSSAEKSKVRSAVHRKFPSIGVSPEGIQGAKMRRHGGRHTKG